VLRAHERLGRRLLFVVIVIAAIAASGNVAWATGTHTELDSVSGTILDVSPDRILFLDSSGSETALKVKDRATAGTSTVPSVSPREPLYGFLTSHGAMFVALEDDNILTAKVYEWRDGQMLEFGFPNSTWSLLVNGDYAIWDEGTTLYRRDLNLGVTVTVDTDVGNTDNDVAANGDVAYWDGSSYEIHRYRNGVSTQLTNDSVLWNTYPRTDGINVVYRKTSQCCNQENGEVAVYTSAGEVVLDSFRNSWPYPPADYDAAGGWVAFTRFGAGGERQVWTRDPSGTETQASPSGTSARIVELNPNGAVMFQTEAGVLYLARPGFAPVDFGASFIDGVVKGRGNYVFWQDGRWFQALGGSLYRLDILPACALAQLLGTAGCVSETGSSGACTDGKALDAAASAAVSPDGTSVYVASFNSDAVAGFQRNGATGELTQFREKRGCTSKGGSGGACAGGRGLDSPRAVAVSPDGKNVYVASFDSDSVAVFQRDAGTGWLFQLSGTAGCVSQTGSGGNCAVGKALDGARTVSVSPDGKNVYVGSFGNDAVAVFSRDTTTGALTQLAGTAGCVSETGSR
jgi:DNA-binding beta-propeller fold protein YncE